ncbi:hypothetical protein KVV02_007485 [Mortierella alpina]|uniref:Uncharacterized protein n=1 Tax=Mortierella alpina TaxID=64518 RepID=A0A9P8A610_MORAP|nr:hypothetical protein KVV02_007485 [Mortierella alpina]
MRRSTSTTAPAQAPEASAQSERLRPKPLTWRERRNSLVGLVWPSSLSSSVNSTPATTPQTATFPHHSHNHNNSHSPSSPSPSFSSSPSSSFRTPSGTSTATTSSKPPLHQAENDRKRHSGSFSSPSTTCPPPTASRTRGNSDTRTFTTTDSHNPTHPLSSSVSTSLHLHSNSSSGQEAATNKPISLLSNRLHQPPHTSLLPRPADMLDSSGINSGRARDNDSSINSGHSHINKRDNSSSPISSSSAPGSTAPAPSSVPVPSEPIRSPVDMGHRPPQAPLSAYHRRASSLPITSPAAGVDSEVPSSPSLPPPPPPPEEQQQQQLITAKDEAEATEHRARSSSDAGPPRIQEKRGTQGLQDPSSTWENALDDEQAGPREPSLSSPLPLHSSAHLADLHPQTLRRAVTLPPVTEAVQTRHVARPLSPSALIAERGVTHIDSKQAEKRAKEDFGLQRALNTGSSKVSGPASSPVTLSATSSSRIARINSALRIKSTAHGSVSAGPSTPKALLELSPSSTQPSTAISSEKNAWPSAISNPEEIEQYRAELSISAYRSLLNTQLKSSSHPSGTGSSNGAHQGSLSLAPTATPSPSSSTFSAVSSAPSPTTQLTHYPTVFNAATNALSTSAHSLHGQSQVSGSASVSPQEPSKSFLSRDNSWHFFKQSTGCVSMQSSPSSYGHDDTMDLSATASSLSSLHVKRASIGNAAAAKLRLSPVNIKLTANSPDQQQYSPSLSSESGSPSPSSGSPLMSSASSISSPHSSINWKARLRRSLSNQEKIQSPLSNVFNPDMVQSESGDGKSSPGSPGAEGQANYIVSREKSYDINPDSPTGSGDEDDYMGEHQRTVTSSFLARSVGGRSRSSVDSNGSSVGAGGAESLAYRERTSERFLPIAQPHSPQSQSQPEPIPLANSAPTRSSYSNQHHYHQHLPVHLHASTSQTGEHGRHRQRRMNRSMDSQKSSLEEQDSSPPVSPTAVPSPYSAPGATQPTEIPAARRSSSLASSPSSYQRHHSVYVLSGQMFKNSPQGSPKSHLARLLASDQENYYTTDSDSDCWGGGKTISGKTSTNKVFSDSDAEEDPKPKKKTRAPIRGFHFPPRTTLRLEYDSDHTTASNNGPSSSRLDKLLSSPSLSAFGGAAMVTSSSLPAFFPDLSANAPQNLVSQIGFMDDSNELNAANALVHEMVRAKTKSDAEIRIVLDGWYECKQDKDIMCLSYQQETPESYESKWAEDGAMMSESPSHWSVMDNGHQGQSWLQGFPDSESWYENNIGPLDKAPAKRKSKTIGKSSRHSSISYTAVPQLDHAASIKGQREGQGPQEVLTDAPDNASNIATPPIDVPSPAANVPPEEEGGVNRRAISRKQSILSRRVIASNSWPPTILASSHTTLLISIECISHKILHTPVSAIIAQPLRAVDIMKSLQTLMDRQRRMAVGNAEAEDLLTKLVYVFAPVCRLAERLHEQHINEDYRLSQVELPSGNLHFDHSSPFSYLDWSPLPSPAMPSQTADGEENIKSKSTPTSSIDHSKQGSHVRSSTQTSTNTNTTTEHQQTRDSASDRRCSPDEPSASLSARSSLDRHQHQHDAVTSETFTSLQHCVVAQHATAFSVGEIQFQSSVSSPSLKLPPLPNKRSSAPPLSRSAISTSSGSGSAAAMIAPLLTGVSPSSLSTSDIAAASATAPELNDKTSLLPADSNSPAMPSSNMITRSLTISGPAPPAASSLSPISPGSLSSPLAAATAAKANPFGLRHRPSVVSTNLVRSQTMESSYSPQPLPTMSDIINSGGDATANDHGMSLTVCRICDEEILLSLLDRHSETCKLQHECSQKLESCNHALGKLGACVWQRREVIESHNRPYVDYHSLKDSEKIQMLAEKACLVVESNLRQAVRKLDKYHHKMMHILQDSKNYSAYDDELFNISEKIAHVIREKLSTIQTIQEQLSLLTNRDAGMDSSGMVTRSQSASAISSQSDLQQHQQAREGTSTSFWGGRKKSKSSKASKDGLTTRSTTKPPLPLQTSQTIIGLSGRRTGSGGPGGSWTEGSATNHIRRESTGSNFSANESETMPGIPIQSSLARKGRSGSIAHGSIQTPPIFPSSTSSEKPSKNFSTIFAAFLRVSRQRIHSYNNLAAQSKGHNGESSESGRNGFFGGGGGGAGVLSPPFNGSASAYKSRVPSIQDFEIIKPVSRGAFGSRNARPDIRRLSDGNIAEISSGNVGGSHGSTVTLTTDVPETRGSVSMQKQQEESASLMASFSDSPAVAAVPVMASSQSSQSQDSVLTHSPSPSMNMDRNSINTIRPRLMNHGRSKSVSNRVSFSPLSTLSSTSSIHRMKSTSSMQASHLSGVGPGEFETPLFLAEQPLGSPLAKQIENELFAQHQSLLSPSLSLSSSCTGAPTVAEGVSREYSSSGYFAPRDGGRSSMMPPSLESRSTLASLHEQEQDYEEELQTRQQEDASNQENSQHQLTSNMTSTAKLGDAGQKQHMEGSIIGLGLGLDNNNASHALDQELDREILAQQQQQRDDPGEGDAAGNNSKQRKGGAGGKGGMMQRSLSIESEFESFSYKNVTLLNDVNMEAMMMKSKNLATATASTTGSGAGTHAPSTPLVGELAVSQGWEVDEGSAAPTAAGTRDSSSASAPGALKSMIQSLGSNSSSGGGHSKQPSQSDGGSAGGRNTVKSSGPNNNSSSKKDRPREPRREGSSGYLLGLGSLTRARSRSRSRSNSALTVGMVSSLSSTVPAAAMNAIVSPTSSSQAMAPSSNSVRDGVGSMSSESGPGSEFSASASATPPHSQGAAVAVAVGGGASASSGSSTNPSNTGSSGHTIFGFGNGSATKLSGSKSGSRAGSRNGSTTSLTLQSMGPGMISMMLKRSSPSGSGTGPGMGGTGGSSPGMLTPTKKTSSSSLGGSSVTSGHFHDDHHQQLQHHDAAATRQCGYNSRRGSAISVASGASSGFETFAPSSSSFGASLGREKILFSSPLSLPSTIAASAMNASGSGSAPATAAATAAVSEGPGSNSQFSSSVPSGGGGVGGGSSVPISPLVLERHEDWGQGLKMGSLLGPMLKTAAAARAEEGCE